MEEVHNMIIFNRRYATNTYMVGWTLVISL